jgi:hypothetical protein
MLQSTTFNGAVFMINGIPQSNSLMSTTNQTNQSAITDDLDDRVPIKVTYESNQYQLTKFGYPVSSSASNSVDEVDPEMDEAANQVMYGEALNR